MYKHGIEGDSRRFKVRMRWYGDLINLNVSQTLELKRKFGHVGDKLKWQISSFLSTETMLQAALKADLLVDNNVDNFEILYTILPIINPVLINRYNRKYLISADKSSLVYSSLGFSKIDLALPSSTISPFCITRILSDIALITFKS